MNIAILITLILQTGIPALLLFWFSHGRSRDRAEFIVNALLLNNIIFFLFQAGRWDYCSYYARFLVLGLFFITLARHIFVILKLKWWIGKGFYRSVLFAMRIFVAFLFGMIDLLMQQGINKPENAIELAFPLKNGRYYVTQGGDFPILNFHNTNPAQRFAVEIVKLNSLGLRSDGLKPKNLKDYFIYHDTVFAPCIGNVISVENGLQNMPTDSLDEDHPSGNNLVIQFKQGYLMLANLDSGSVKVKPGDKINTGKALALVGNSGNSSEPHLKIFASAGSSPEAILHGEGLPLLFDHNFLTRNQVVAK